MTTTDPQYPHQQRPGQDPDQPAQQEYLDGTPPDGDVRDAYAPDAYSPDDDPQDDDLLAEDARRRPGKLTLALAGAIVLVGVFGAGVLTQKHFGGTTVVAGAAGGARARAAGGFSGEGVFPGGQGGFGGQGLNAAGASGSSSGGPAAAAPVVVGTVVKVSGNTVTVKNFAGKLVTVTVPSGTSVTRAGSVSDLSKGTTVSVAGSKASDGSVTASSVTARKK